MKPSRTFAGSAAVVACSVLLASALGSAAQAQDAKQLFEKNCVACHGAGGKGDGAAAKVLKPPPVDFAVALKGKSDADIHKVIKEGGKAVGKAASMPTYGSKLTDDQIQALTQYVKGLAK
jgi:mono/diheme cytochrome c family protein